MSWTLLSFYTMSFLISFFILTNYFPPLSFLAVRVELRPSFFSSLI